MTVSQVRYAGLFLSLGVLLLGAAYAQRLAFDNWWLWVAVATLLSILLSEPRYTNPVAALVNGVAALAAIASSSYTTLPALWLAAAAYSALVVLGALLTLLLRPSQLTKVTKKIATKGGTARILGFGVLLLEAYVEATEGSETGALIAAVAIAMLLTSSGVQDLFVRETGTTRASNRFSVLGHESPNLLSVLSPTPMPNGTVLRVWIGGITYTCRVISGHADAAGAVHLIASTTPIALDSMRGHRSIKFEIDDVAQPAKGVVIQGSTPTQLVLRPTIDLSTGALVSRRALDGTDVLYQVTSSELVRVGEDGRYSTEQRAWASQIGRIDASSEIEFDPRLATAFDPVYAIESLTGSLPPGFVEVGKLAGTDFPVGFNATDASTGHLAVLGMSGMGKTTAARRLIDALSASNAVAVVDVGGEYAGRLGLTSSSQAAYLAAPSASGHGAIEIAAPVVLGFKNFTQSVFDLAKSEYGASAPKNRVIVAEEAHSLVPEWNSVIERYDSQHVAATCAIVLQARKYGLRFVFVSQRTANVSKSAISQCANYIVFRMVDETGLEYLSSVAGPSYVQVVRTLKPHQALLVGPAFSTGSPVIVDTLNWIPAVP